MPDLVNDSPRRARCKSIWVTLIIVWDIMPIICRKNSWSSSLSLERVSDVIELLCMVSCSCLICSLDCFITSHRRGVFLGPPDLPLFLFGFDVWVAFAAPDSAAFDSVALESAPLTDCVSLSSTKVSFELAIKCSLGGSSTGWVPKSQTHSMIPSDNDDIKK